MEFDTEDQVLFFILLKFKLLIDDFMKYRPEGTSKIFILNGQDSPVSEENQNSDPNQ